MSEVRFVRTTLVPRPVNTSLYAPSTSATDPFSARLFLPGLRICSFSKAVTSSSVKNSLPANLAGRSSGVRMYPACQMP